jgi:hypothetical protein
MSTTVATSEVLNRAADLIERDGWHQGNYAPGQTEHGVTTDGLPVCAIGALYGAMGRPLSWDAALGCWVGDDAFDLEVSAVVAAHLNLSSPLDIPVWNDSDRREVSEVVEVLRAAAVIEAAREQKMAEVSA